MILGTDHGYYAIKTRNCSFPAGITPYGSHEPYTRQNVLAFGGCFLVCSSGRQPIQRDKTANDNYYPADAGGYSAGAAGPWCAAGVQRDRRSGAAPDQLRPGEACAPQVPAPQCGATDRVRLRGQEVPNHD